jgi:hypothetical protein
VTEAAVAELATRSPEEYGVPVVAGLVKADERVKARMCGSFRLPSKSR